MKFRGKFIAPSDVPQGIHEVEILETGQMFEANGRLLGQISPWPPFQQLTLKIGRAHV